MSGLAAEGLIYSSTVVEALRFLPPNMAALFGPAIGARISRQDELGHTTHRALAQHKPNKTIYSLFATNTTVLLLRWLPNRAHQNCVSHPVPLVGWPQGSTNKLYHKIYSCPESHDILPKPPTQNQYAYTYPAPEQHNRTTPYTNSGTRSYFSAEPNRQPSNTQTTTYHTQNSILQEPQPSPTYTASRKPHYRHLPCTNKYNTPPPPPGSRQESPKSNT